MFYSGALELFKRAVNKYNLKESEEGKRSFPFFVKRVFRNLQILVYHRVNDERDPFFSGIPVTTFQSEMEYLSLRCSVLDLEEALYRLRSGDLPDNAVVVTFDDGYKDNFLNAFPILKQLSIPATIFLATEVIGSDRALWHDRVFSAFRETRVVGFDGIVSDRRRYPLRNLEEKLTAQREVLKLLWALDDCERLYWIDRLASRLEVCDRRDRPDLMLNWEEIRKMQEHKISFGSHTVTHPILSRISAAKIRRELISSRETIEKQLGVPVGTFAYPVGRGQDFNGEVKALLQEAGYICAVTTIPGANEPGQDPFELRRGTPWETYLPAFATKLSWYKFC